MRFKIVVLGLIVTAILSGCMKQTEEKEDHLTVFMWDNNMIKHVAPYIKEQIPDSDIEFLAGNNNVDLYNYLEEHGDLPDIITTRRYSGKDAKELQPYLLDFGAYDIVSQYYPYALQYYADSNEDVKWLPVCGIPETIIANKSLFDQYGIKIPENYEEFAQCCEDFQKLGIKPYTSELSADWAAHSLIQGAAIDQFTSMDGIRWRNDIEAQSDENVFEDKVWKQIFQEVHTFIRDTGLTDSDLECDINTAREHFTNKEAAMFRGTPAVMERLQSETQDELVRLPYFSQTNDESWIYTYPSFNIAFNQSLEKNPEKLDLAMKVLECFISEEGQKLVADGDGMISYNVNVKSDLNGMTGVEAQAMNNAFYIRYASNNSFAASYDAVKGLVSGTMDEEQAYETFRHEMMLEAKKEPSVAKFEKQYNLGLNQAYGRDAASVILTTVRQELGARLALSSYYYYTSSLYAGDYTETNLKMMLAHNDGASLFRLNLTGAQITKLLEQYLENREGFRVTNKYELPIASGMKLSVSREDNKFLLKGIEVDGQPLNSGDTYEILVTKEFKTLLKTLYPDQNFEEGESYDLSAEWTSLINSGKQPSEPEDYIAVEGTKR